MTYVATQVGERMEMPIHCVRRYLRTAVRRGQLVELVPDGAWRVTWQEAYESGIGPVRIAVEMYRVAEKREATRLVLVADSSPLRSRRGRAPYGTTYVLTARQAKLFIERERQRQPALR
jgi:hypothetical protein